MNEDLRTNDSAILFKDVVNHIEIHGLKDLTQHRVVTEGAMLSLLGNNKLLVANINKDSVRIKVLSNKPRGHKKEVYSKWFLVQYAGDPKVLLDEKIDQTFSNGQTINNTSLEVEFSNHNYSGKVAVAHFEITLIDSLGNERLAPTFVSGKYLGKTIYDKIIALPTGAIISFTQVILIYPDGGYRKYEDFKLGKK